MKTFNDKEDNIACYTNAKGKTKMLYISNGRYYYARYSKNGKRHLVLSHLC
jgi:myo-inositol-hexaphosphate 3-phosphohydrolase